MKTVCLLTAGIGSRMGEYAGIVNKTLLPVDNKAIISHIIEQFPVATTEFIVATGYKSDDVASYLYTAHPRIRLKLINVDNFQGEGSGPGYSLKKCKQVIKGEFLLIACDGLYSDLDKIPLTENYMGVGDIKKSQTPYYCNVQIDDNKNIVEIKDKVACDFTSAASGVWAIHEYEKFWEDLENTEISTGFKRMQFKAFDTAWVDLGTYDKYKNYINKSVPYDFSKPDEMLYFVNNRVIKYFAKDNVSFQKAGKSGRIRDLPLTEAVGSHIIFHQFVPGKTLNEYTDLAILEKLATYMNETIWNPLVHRCLYSGDLYKFYMEKTMQRLAMFEKKYPTFAPRTVNGKNVTNDIYKSLMKLDWYSICNKDLKHRTRQIHGDLQFDNIIYNEELDKITLIDWRGDFAGLEVFGDMYYDLAKLIAGSIINYAKIKAGEFTYTEDGDKIIYEIKDHIAFKTNLVKEAFDITDPIIDQLVTLVFLNMAPLHNPPFDKILYCIALERLNLL